MLRTDNCSTNQVYDNYIPIDFIKGELVGFDVSLLLRNNHLNFGELINRDTGEIIRAESNGCSKQEYRVATISSMTFKYYPNSNRMFISGSIHKYYNIGKHNYNRFTLKAFREVLEDFEECLGIMPQNIKLTQIEYGVNLNLDIKSDILIDHYLFYKRVMFSSGTMESGNTKYVQARLNNYLIKIYDKALQYNLNNNILRYERKEIKYSCHCRKYGIGQTLQDLMNSGFIGLKNNLINSWKCIVFYDPYMKDINARQLKYRDRLYWKRLYCCRSNSTIKKHHDNLKRMNKSKGRDLHSNIYIEITKELERANEFTL